MSQLWGNTFLCFCSVAGGASHQRPLLLREEWGKKQGEMRGNEDSDQAQWDLGRRRLWGQERSWGGCPQQQELEAEDARAALMPLPISPFLFKKHRVKTIIFLKALTFWCQAGGASHTAHRQTKPPCPPGARHGQPAPAAPPAPGQWVCGSSQPDPGH